MKELLLVLLFIANSVFAQTSGAPIHNIMRLQIAPSTDALFALQGKSSLTEKEWSTLNLQLESLHAGAHTLKKLTLNTVWQKHANEVDRLSELATAQSNDRNIRGLTRTGNSLYQVCESCHNHFFPDGKNL